MTAIPIYGDFEVDDELDTMLAELDGLRNKLISGEIVPPKHVYWEDVPEHCLTDELKKHKAAGLTLEAALDKIVDDSEEEYIWGRKPA